MNILQILSSYRTVDPEAGSHSSRLANELVQQLLVIHPEAELTVRDLARSPHPILDQDALNALFTPAGNRTPEQAARVALDETLIAELQAADLIVLGAPMYNFGISALLKAWFDAVARAGVTFRYTHAGPVGLLADKTVYAVSTRGGSHRGQSTDHVVPYLRTMFGFLGIVDVHFVYAEGLALGAEAEVRAFADASAQFARLVRAADPIGGREASSRNALQARKAR